MAVLVEGISVIILRHAIDDRFDGGWSGFLRAVPNNTLCTDERLVRVGFMNPHDVRAYVSSLEERGLRFRDDTSAVDFSVVDQFRGPTLPTPWLKMGGVESNGMSLKVCWLSTEAPGDVAVPAGWKYEGSLSAKAIVVSPETEADRVKFLRREGAQDVYLDLRTGKEVFVGRPTVEGSSEVALFPKLETICHEALQIEAQSEPLKALNDVESAAPLYERLRNELLPEAARIAAGPGCAMGFAHFTHGLLLRILGQLEEAEAAFLRANQMSPRTLNVLRELVRCLGEQRRHTEALTFAREAVEVGSLDPGAWGNLAMCLINAGKREEARDAIDYAIDLDPQDPLNRYIRDNFDAYFTP